MCHKINAHTFRTHQTDDLLYLVDQSLRRVLEEHVGLIEEEYQFGQFQITHFGQLGVEFTQQPEQKRRIKLGIQHQLIGSQHIHDAASAFRLKEIEHVERRLAKELLGTFSFQSQEGTLDGTHTHRSDGSVCSSELLCIFRHIIQHHPQVLHINEEQASVVSNLENYIQDAGLGLVQSQKARQELRSHIRDGSSQRMALLTIHIKEACRATMELRIFDAEFRTAFLNETTHLSRLANSRQVTFHVSHETRDTCLTERFGQHLQGHRLTRTRSTSNQSMSVGHFSNHVDGAIIAMRNVELLVFCIHISLI